MTDMSWRRRGDEDSDLHDYNYSQGTSLVSHETLELEVSPLGGERYQREGISHTKGYGGIAEEVDREVQRFVANGGSESLQSVPSKAIGARPSESWDASGMADTHAILQRLNNFARLRRGGEGDSFEESDVEGENGYRDLRLRRSHSAGPTGYRRRDFGSPETSPSNSWVNDETRPPSPMTLEFDSDGLPVPPPGLTISEDRAVRVFCRIRPQTELEVLEGGVNCVRISKDSAKVTVDPAQGQERLTVTFDHVFNPDTTQREVYEKVASPVVDGLLYGLNGTIFAYGQTSSGKTYTMLGPQLRNAKFQGMIPRTVSGLFDRLGRLPQNIKWRTTVMMVEIYQERIRDLLAPQGFESPTSPIAGAKAGPGAALGPSLELIRDEDLGVHISGATELKVQDAGQCMEVLDLGSRTRAVATTSLNEYSSRSHSVFILTLEMRCGDVLRVGRLFLVDLAGSEKVLKSGVWGSTLKEAQSINLSLSTLGNVINALVSKAKHIPYRDSKLTRLLQDGLGGNSQTALVVNVSPSSYNREETRSSLRFGSTAKRMHTKTKVNMLSADEKAKRDRLRLMQKARTYSSFVRTKNTLLENMRAVEKSRQQQRREARRRMRRPLARLETGGGRLMRSKSTGRTSSRSEAGAFGLRAGVANTVLPTRVARLERMKQRRKLRKQGSRASLPGGLGRKLSSRRVPPGGAEEKEDAELEDFEEAEHVEEVEDVETETTTFVDSDSSEEFVRETAYSKFQRIPSESRMRLSGGNRSRSSSISGTGRRRRSPRTKPDSYQDDLSDESPVDELEGEHVIFSVRLRSSHFGLKLYSGMDEPIVEAVLPTAAPAVAELVKTGDKVVKVNDIPLSGLSVRDAWEELKAAAQEVEDAERMGHSAVVTLTFARAPIVEVLSSPRPSRAPSATGHRILDGAHSDSEEEEEEEVEESPNGHSRGGEDKRAEGLIASEARSHTMERISVIEFGEGGDDEGKGGGEEIPAHTGDTPSPSLELSSEGGDEKLGENGRQEASVTEGGEGGEGGEGDDTQLPDSETKAEGKEDEKSGEEDGEVDEDLLASLRAQGRLPRKSDTTEEFGTEEMDRYLDFGELSESKDVTLEQKGEEEVEPGVGGEASGSLAEGKPQEDVSGESDKKGEGRVEKGLELASEDEQEEKEASIEEPGRKEDLLRSPEEIEGEDEEKEKEASGTERKQDQEGEDRHNERKTSTSITDEVRAERMARQEKEEEERAQAAREHDGVPMVESPRRDRGRKERATHTPEKKRRGEMEEKVEIPQGGKPLDGYHSSVQDEDGTSPADSPSKPVHDDNPPMPIPDRRQEPSGGCCFPRRRKKKSRTVPT